MHLTHGILQFRWSHEMRFVSHTQNFLGGPFLELFSSKSFGNSVTPLICRLSNYVQSFMHIFFSRYNKILVMLKIIQNRFKQIHLASVHSIVKVSSSMDKMYQINANALKIGLWLIVKLRSNRVRRTHSEYVVFHCTLCSPRITLIMSKT